MSKCTPATMEGHHSSVCLLGQVGNKPYPSSGMLLQGREGMVPKPCRQCLVELGSRSSSRMGCVLTAVNCTAALRRG